MEAFRYLLFGVVGASVIFWVCVIALWHTYMFPRLFSEDSENIVMSGIQSTNPERNGVNEALFMQVGALRPLIKGSTLIDRSKYSRKSLVIADFNPVETGYKTNRLYTLVLLSLSIMSFLIISYGLRSGFTAYGIAT